MKYTILFMTAGLLAAMISGCAVQGDVIALDNRLALLEQRYSALQKNEKNLQQQSDDVREQNRALQLRIEQLMSGRQEKELELRDQSAGIQALIDRLRDENKIAAGRLEEFQYQMKQKQAALEQSSASMDEKLAKLGQDLELDRTRIARLEQYLNIEASEKKQVEKKNDGPAEKVFSESEIYTLAKQAFDQGDFEASRQGFNRLLKLNPKSDNADNAQFWIAEIYYREKWYEKAILEYQKVIENYPKGNKVQAALLKQGLSFYNLGDKTNARLILNELARKYPKSNEAAIAQQKLKEIQ